MADANLWAFLNELFAVRGSVLPGILGANGDTVLWADSTNGSVNGSGETQDHAFSTIQACVDKINNSGIFTVSQRAYILVAPGQYDETVTIERSDLLQNLTIIGLGGRGAAFIEPTTEDAAGMIVDSDDVTLINIGVAAEDETSAVALTVTGARFRAYGCKIEGGLDQVVIGPGTVAQVDTAGTKGDAGDGRFQDCEFCWGTNGINLTCTDYGAVTQLVIENCHFHNLSTKHIKETVGSGGSAAVTFQNVVIRNNYFDDLDVGTAPTNYIDLNGDNANTGLVCENFFPTAINSGLNLVSTAMHWVGNFHTGGLSTGQPS